MTSPSEPRTASGQAGGRRGPGAGVWRRRGARDERAARRVGRRRGARVGSRRGLAPGDGGALGLGSGSGSEPLSLRR